MDGCGRSVQFMRTEPRGYSDHWAPSPMHFVCGVEGLCPSCAATLHSENAKLLERVEDLNNLLEYVYRAIDFGFTYGSFDLSILRKLSRDYVRNADGEEVKL